MNLHSTGIKDQKHKIICQITDIMQLGARTKFLETVLNQHRSCSLSAVWWQHHSHHIHSYRVFFMYRVIQ